MRPITVIDASKHVFLFQFPQSATNEELESFLNFLRTCRIKGVAFTHDVKIQAIKCDYSTKPDSFSTEARECSDPVLKAQPLKPAWQ